MPHDRTTNVPANQVGQTVQMLLDTDDVLIITVIKQPDGKFEVTFAVE